MLKERLDKELDILSEEYDKNGYFVSVSMEGFNLSFNTKWLPDLQEKALEIIGDGSQEMYISLDSISSVEAELDSSDIDDMMRIITIKTKAGLKVVITGYREYTKEEMEVMADEG